VERVVIQHRHGRIHSLQLPYYTRRWEVQDVEADWPGILDLTTLSLFTIFMMYKKMISNINECEEATKKFEGEEDV
jgi:hypothetical protein